MPEKQKLLQLFHVSAGSFCHKLFGTNVVKSNLKQSVSPHFDHGQHLALAKGCVHDGVPFIVVRQWG